MRVQRLVGAVSRASPRAHGPFYRWLSRHPGDREITYRDSEGLSHTADLRDHMERGWFAGVPMGLPRDVLGRIPAGTLAIDVGANVGIVTGQLALRVASTGRVWAVEPIPRNVSRLSRFTETNRLPIDVFPVAAGAQDGELDLRLPDAEQSGYASATASWIDAGRLTVPLRSIDSLIAERRPHWRLSFVKIDVEGYEAEVLEGARETLAASRPLVYAEFNDIVLRDRGSSSLEVLERFAAAAYRPIESHRVLPLEGRVVDLLLEPQS